jgi:hypothetical protein
MQEDGGVRAADVSFVLDELARRSPTWRSPRRT